MSARGADLSATLASLVELPNALESDVQALRFASEDLADLGDQEVWQASERERLACALLPVRDGRWSWHWQRLGACERELASRKGAKR